MKGILSDKKAISAGIISAVVLTVLRIIQLNTARLLTPYTTYCSL